MREEVNAETELIKKGMAVLRTNMVTKQDIQHMATKQDMQLLEQSIEKEAKPMGDFFHETWTRMETTNERVERIEHHLGLPPRVCQEVCVNRYVSIGVFDHLFPLDREQQMSPALGIPKRNRAKDSEVVCVFGTRWKPPNWPP